jgi:lipopolysaccharide transport system ATP-binding protein
MGAVSQLCERAMWLDSGQIVKMGYPHEVIHDYLDTSDSKTGTWTNSLIYETEPDVKLLSASIMTAEGGQTAVVRFDEAFNLEVYCEVLTSIRSWSLLFRVSDSAGAPVFTSWDTDSGSHDKPTGTGKLRAICHVPAKFLRPGAYSVSLGTCVPYPRAGRKFNSHQHIFRFEVSSVGYTMNVDRQGVITPVLKWSIERNGG